MWNLVAAHWLAMTKVVLARYRHGARRWAATLLAVAVLLLIIVRASGGSLEAVNKTSGRHMAQMFLEWHDDRWIAHTSMETLRAFDLHVEFDSNFTISHHGERSWLVPCPIRMTYRADFTRWYWPNPIAMKETLQDWDRLYLLQESIESAMKSNEYFGWKLQGCQMEQCFTFADCGISFNAVMFNASVWLSRIIRLFAGVLGIVFFVDVIAVGRRMFVLAFRRSRSQCIECGYQLLAGQRQCPECGAQVVLETNRE